MRFKTSFFSIYLYSCAEDNMCFCIKELFGIYALFSVPKLMSFNPVMIKADPFFFVENDILHLFYEEKRVFGLGKIKMIMTKDLKNWSTPKTVLKENFHLSFPFVFKCGTNYYMIPETEEDDSIRLYKSENEELTQWNLVNIILSATRTNSMQINYSDSCIWYKDGIYYLFTSQKCNGIYQLLLYMSKELGGTYEPHPKSPICVSNRYGRNGGALFMHADKLYRPSQDCSISYGANVSIHEIITLTTTEYEECLCMDDIVPREKDIYVSGGHHFNVTEYLGKYIIATDGKSDSVNLGSLLHKVWTLIHKMK